MQRQFTVEYLGEGKERYTCRTCGGSFVEQTYPMGTNEAFAKKMSSYRATGSGVAGICPKCTKQTRDERYPLKEE